VTANTATLLLQHYVDNFRRLPWRAAPGEAAPDPYRVWLSEVMLQQTTVATVTPRFERFVERWPTIDALAAASDEEVLTEWAGLGYYARARNLIACVREIARRGSFPPTAAELRRLPGLGDYIAAAIAAIAFGERVAVVDTNVARILARLNALKSATRAHVQSLALAMTPADRPGDFAQAMMDLGATICRPKAPRCGSCPVQPFCAAFHSGSPPDSFPAAKPKAIRPKR
jgi:A/G-specific adenine glycosylase